MNFIKVYLITVDINPCENQIYIESLVKIQLKKPFNLGEIFLCKDIWFTITKVENTTHIYEFIPNRTETKVISKSSTETFETEEIFTFYSTTEKKVLFPKVLKMSTQLFGLDEIEKTVIKYLDEAGNDAICLHGPPGNGKGLLAEKMEEIYKDKHFFYLEALRLEIYKNELSCVMNSIQRIRNPIVLVIDEIDNINEDYVDMHKFLGYLKELLNDDGVDIKIIMIASNVQSINEKIQKLISRKIAVPNINEKDRMCFVKYLISKLIDRESFEEGFEEFIKNLHGFSADGIENFIMRSYNTFPESQLRLEQLKKCTKMNEMIPRHLTRCVENIEPLYWSDIGGYENVKEELIKIFQRPLKYGFSIPKGILLHGPPGCSKTMFARALATECELKLISLTPSSVMRGIVGESEAALQSIIAQALVLAPSIIFIDEIDTLIPKRTSKVNSSVGEHLLSELMTFLDGIETKKDQKVILMGATNRLYCVDEALIRSGRMNFLIEIGLPDQAARESILKIVFSDQKYKIEKEIIAVIARMSEGKSGAEIVDIGKRIKKLSELHSITTITLDHISEVFPDLNDLIDRTNSLSI